jgi:hypothetical protein
MGMLLDAWWDLALVIGRWRHVSSQWQTRKSGYLWQQLED